MAEQYSATWTGTRVEHWLTLLGGTALVVYGLARRSVGGVALALLGGDLIYHELAHEHVHIHQVYGLDVPRVQVVEEKTPQVEGVKIQRSVTINRSPEDLYRFWRNWENLPRVFDYIRSVKPVDSTHSHWIATSPAGLTIEWDTAIAEDVPNQLISWRSVEGAAVSTAGSIRLTRPADGKGTRVSVTLEFDPPSGPLGKAFAELLGEMPSQTTREQLNRLKQMLETQEPSPVRTSLRTLWESR